jgi:hypothetical protein
MMNTKRILLVAMLVAICAAAALGAVGTRAAHAALSTQDKIALYHYCRIGGKDPKFCCETVGGAYTTYIGSDGLIHTQCVFADSPLGNSSNFAVASPPFQGSLNGPTISVTQSGGQSGAGLYGVVQISETLSDVIP